MTREAEQETTAIARASAIITAILMLVAGAFAYVDLLQISGLALLCALASSLASAAERRSRGGRWIGPAIVGAALVTVVIVGFMQR